MNSILALDSSGKTAGVCILQNNNVLFEKTIDEGLTHSETLMLLVKEALDVSGLSPREINTYAVTAGPGSFTGLRIAMSVIKGMALVHKTPVVPVSTLLATAFASGCNSGTLVCALDARRSEVYWAAFSCQNGIRRLTEDSAGPADKISDYVNFNTGKVIFVGDGAYLCYNVYGYTGNVEVLSSKIPIPVAKGAALAAAGFMAENAIPANKLKPCYLRLSQAERERNNRLAGL